MLIPKQETYYILDSKELDQLIQQHFKKPDFNCVVAYEWFNDSEHTGIVLVSNLENDELAQKDLQKFIQNPDTPDYPVHWSFLLAELVRRNEVPEGNYLIEVCW